MYLTCRENGYDEKITLIRVELYLTCRGNNYDEKIILIKGWIVFDMQGKWF